MKVSLTPELPQPHKNTLLVAFLSEDQREETLQHLQLSPEGPGLAKNGKKKIWSEADRLVLSIGMASDATAEHYRQSTHQAVQMANEYGFKQLVLGGSELKADAQLIEAVTESLLLSHYQFLTYKSKKQVNSLERAQIIAEGDEALIGMAFGELKAESTQVARDLVNEPLITLTAVELAKRIETLGQHYGFNVEVLEKARIEALKMGGLLAVNLGSPDPPTFSILEYKPKKPVNKKPIVLVGKGVVYDTGGLSLKPTANSMDFMKADMAGAAAVVGAFCGLARAQAEQWVIGLVPATDNRPGQNAYVPGDVIKMYDGSTVEVLNTDAEGRMLLADALAYAKQYDPSLVIDLATLTGAKVVAIGSPGLAMMSTAEDEVKQAFQEAGQRVHERLVELPLWEEYGEMLRSDIADRKNIGGSEAGSITAGKFLEHFTDYPWIHLDIAGSAWLKSPDSYRGKNGTGVGVRLLLEYITSYGKD
jgi:leucyl aminopeptidase